MSRLFAKTLAAAAALSLLGGNPARANPASVELSARAANNLYNLDRDRAIEIYREAVKTDPDDAAAYRGLASALWLSITIDRGNLTVDDYLGKVSRSNLKLPPARPETLAAFRDAVARSLALGRKHIAANPKDVDAHFQLGAAVALRATYVATVDGSVIGAFRAAHEAFDEHEEVLKLDPRRADAGLVVGTYRYVVSVLALPLRWVAYIAGFGGGREKGLAQIEAAAEYPGDNQTDARLALVLLYNREQRYDAALAQLARLRERYPGNRLFAFETGATTLRWGHALEAEQIFSDGIRRFQSEPGARMFGEESLWYYKRGFAREILGRGAEAEEDLRKAIAVEGRAWVHGRAHLELGKVLLFRGDRAASSVELRQAISLCDNDNDSGSADEARHWIK